MALSGAARRVAFVTGASRGIGRATALALAAKLARLFALGVDHVSLTPTHLSAAETLRLARSLAA